MILLIASVTTNYGQDIESIDKENPVQLTGGLSFNSSFYNANGIPKRRSPFSYSLSGSPVLTLYGISMPFTFTYSDEQSNFSQPFNRFGVSPYYKWVKLHLGYRNVKFSPYTLGGQTFLGAGIELTPGILRFGAIYGRFRESIEEDLSLPGDSGLYRAPLPSYARKGYAFKLGIGNQDNYIDFIYFKAKDDPNSLEEDPVKYDVDPAENAVLGISKKITFFKSLSWQTDIGISLYTQNVMLEALDDSTIKGSSILDNFVEPNISTQLLLAGETSLKLTRKTYSLQLKYKRVDPEYKSMGIYYMQSDLEQYTFTPSFHLFKNKLMASGSIGYQKDNLYGKKALRTGRTIGSANISFNPNQKYGLNLVYSNYGFRQNSSGLLDRYTDSMLVHQVSQNISLIPRISFMKEKANHVVFLNVGYQETRNKNILNNMVSDMTSLNYSANYSFFHIASGTSFTPSVFINSTTVQAGKLKSTGTSVNLSKPFFSNRLRNALMLSYTSNQFDGQRDGHTININGSLQYALSKNMNHNLNLGFTWIRNVSEQDIKSELAQTESFTESIGNVGYSYHF